MCLYEALLPRKIDARHTAADGAGLHPSAELRVGQHHRITRRICDDNTDLGKD